MYQSSMVNNDFLNAASPCQTDAGVAGLASFARYDMRTQEAILAAQVRQVYPTAPSAWQHVLL